MRYASSESDDSDSQSSESSYETTNSSRSSSSDCSSEEDEEAFSELGMEVVTSDVGTIRRRATRHNSTTRRILTLPRESYEQYPTPSSKSKAGSLAYHSQMGRCAAVSRVRARRRSTVDCISTYLLVCAALFWLYSHYYVDSRPRLSEADQVYADGVRKKVRRHSKQELDRLRQKQSNAYLAALPNPFKANKRKNIEALAPGCDYASWQKTSFPTCNDVHDLDLVDLFTVRKPANASPFARGERKAKYIGNGLWRSVYGIKPRWSERNETRDQVVLKFMKFEHEPDRRNFDRHRRDALVMERLSSSNSIVNIFGHCGNTVITEIASTDLESEISYLSHSGSLTPERRLQLALGATRAVAAIHDQDVLHADLQAKQFLVDAKGNIKLNDFNRCRFLSFDNDTKAPCDLFIPSAPGSQRSPEEYAIQSLTLKADVYSLANVLYMILTGKKAWQGEGAATTKKYIRRGKLPDIPSNLRQPNTTDAALAVLVELAYELDPQKRISAFDLMQEIESLSAKTQQV